jgi:hypothetical protein
LSTGDPGSGFNYSSGTTNIIVDILTCALCEHSTGSSGSSGQLGGDKANSSSSSFSPQYRKDLFTAFLTESLTGPLACPDLSPKFDRAGTFVGSSYMYGTALDFASLPLLYMNGGVVPPALQLGCTDSGSGSDSSSSPQQRLLPEGWCEYGHTLSGSDAETGEKYGAHWWVDVFGDATYSCNGFEGQFAIAVPDADAVVVRLGRSLAANGQKDRLKGQLAAVVAEVRSTYAASTGGASAKL